MTPRRHNCTSAADRIAANEPFERLIPTTPLAEGGTWPMALPSAVAPAGRVAINSAEAGGLSLLDAHGLRGICE